MSRKQTCIAVTYAILGIAAGIVVLFAFDMLAMHGKYFAHHLRTQQPECGSQCHASRTYYQHAPINHFAFYGRR